MKKLQIINFKRKKINNVMNSMAAEFEFAFSILNIDNLNTNNFCY